MGGIVEEAPAGVSAGNFTRHFTERWFRKPTRRNSRGSEAQEEDTEVTDNAGLSEFFTSEARAELVQRINLALSAPDYTDAVARKLLVAMNVSGDQVPTRKLLEVLRFLREGWGLPRSADSILHVLIQRMVVGFSDSPPPTSISFAKFVEILVCFFRRVRDRILTVRIERSAFIKNRGIAFESVYDKGVLLGSGSFGTVHTCCHRTTRNERVVKTILKSRIGAPAEELEVELDVLRQLDHPHIVRVFEAFENLDAVLLVMEFARGGDVKKYIAEHRELQLPLETHWVKHAIKQGFRGLGFIHSKNIMHCDIKPANLLLRQPSGSRGPPVIAIADFGLAELANSAAATERGRAGDQGGIKGSPPYIAPEVWDGPAALSFKSDVWSMGVVTFECLASCRPFQGMNYMHVMQQIRETEPNWDELSDRGDEVVAFVKSLLAKLPEDRPWSLEAGKVAWLNQPDPEEWQSVSALEDLGPSMTDVFAEADQASHFEQTILAYIASNLNIVELQSLTDLFLEMDRNGDGVLDREELAAGLKNWESASVEPAQLLAVLDTDRDGKIQYSEFLSGTRALRESLTDQMLQMAFDMIDLDADGFLSVSELRTMLSGSVPGGSLADVLPDGTTVEELFAELNGKGDRVSFAHFKDYVKRQMEPARRCVRPQMSLEDVQDALAPDIPSFEKWCADASGASFKQEISSATLIFRDKETEWHYVRSCSRTTCRAVCFMALAASLQSAYLLNFSLMFSHQETTLDSWCLCPKGLFNGALLLSCVSGILLAVGSWLHQGSQPVILEWVVAGWAGVVAVLTCSFGNRWRVAQMFDAPAKEVFVSYDGDDSLLLWMLALISFLCIATELRWFLLVVLSSTVVGVYIASSAALGTPGDEDAVWPGNAAMFAATVLILMLGQRNVELGRRRRFQEKFRTWRLHAIMKQSRWKGRARKQSLFSPQQNCEQHYQSVEDLLQQLAQHPTVRDMGLQQDIDEAIKSIESSRREFRRLLSRWLEGSRLDEKRREILDSSVLHRSVVQHFSEAAMHRGQALRSLEPDDKLRPEELELDEKRCKLLSEVAAQWQALGADWTVDVLSIPSSSSGHILEAVGEVLLVPVCLVTIEDAGPSRALLADLGQRLYCASVPFHNESHAAALLHRSRWLALTSGLWERMQLIEQLAFCLAGAGLFAGHFGRTPHFCMATNHPLAQLYVDGSELQRYHAALLNGAIHSSGLLHRLPAKDAQSLISWVLTLVLQSDQYFETTSALTVRSDIGLHFEDRHDRLLGATAVLQGADLGYLCLPWSRGHEEWCWRLMDELWDEGDEATSLGMAPAPLCDRTVWQRDTGPIMKSYVSALAVPFFRALCAVVPAGSTKIGSVCCDSAEKNATQWGTYAPGQEYGVSKWMGVVSPKQRGIGIAFMPGLKHLQVVPPMDYLARCATSQPIVESDKPSHYRGLSYASLHRACMSGDLEHGLSEARRVKANLREDSDQRHTRPVVISQDDSAPDEECWDLSDELEILRSTDEGCATSGKQSVWTGAELSSVGWRKAGSSLAPLEPDAFTNRVVGKCP
mmetsp:Transcript_39853/g.104363  ORF Transcript_39853/g.104363 Transcript_39853/m.104363 type:complete len:1550 (+) Transcript_39853:51-4700(+)